MIDRTN